MASSGNKGQCELVERVINQGICVKCGACVGLCPYFDYFDGRVMVTDECRAETWRCLQLCPRADDEDTALLSTAGERAGGESELGPYKKIVIGRAMEKETREKAQYGGFVSALLIYAREKGLIRSCILTSRGDEMSPMGVVARNRGDILDCAGSRYTASAALAALNRAIKDGAEGLAVVGLPCQMEALARMRRMQPDGEEWHGRIRFRIGLFCTWALDYRGLSQYLRQAGLRGAVQKFDIPPPPAQVFQVLSAQGWREFPLDEIRPFVQAGCSLCPDMTAERADISVGTVEGRAGWNTVVVRTERGSGLLDGAVDEGVIELDHLQEEALAHLKEASLNKRKRGLLAQEQRRQEGS